MLALINSSCPCLAKRTDDRDNVLCQIERFLLESPRIVRAILPTGFGRTSCSILRIFVKIWSRKKLLVTHKRYRSFESGVPVERASRPVCLSGSRGTSCRRRAKLEVQDRAIGRAHAASTVCDGAQGEPVVSGHNHG